MFKDMDDNPNHAKEANAVVNNVRMRGGKRPNFSFSNFFDP